MQNQPFDAVGEARAYVDRFQAIHDEMVANGLDKQIATVLAQDATRRSFDNE